LEASPLNRFSLEGFVDTFLIDGYDDKVPITEMHRDWFRMVTSEHPRVALAAPRDHSKTTSINHAYGLAAALFKRHPLQLKVCRTRDLAIEKITHAKDELRNNRKLNELFQLREFAKDTEDDFIAVMADGYRFRMMAVGAEQAGLRGRAWGTIRPSLIIVDDAEDDELVLQRERRQKLLKWFTNALIPMGGRKTQYRVIGTILHTDSLLANILENPEWHSRIYQACDEEVSESSLLWPQRWSRERLLEKKREYIGFHNLAGFNMEYRNIARDTESGFFRPEDFQPMTEEDHKKPKTYYVGGDLAFSKKQGRDYTVFPVGGLDEEGILHMVDLRRGRWDGKQVIDEMYSIDEAWKHPAEWFIESGAIKETLGAALELRMREEGYLNICPDLIPTQDKAIRAMPFQARMRGRGVRWDFDGSWFEEARSELLDFSQEGTRGKHDDVVDGCAWLGQGLRRMVMPPSQDDIDLEDYRWAKRQAKVDDGRSQWTGY
jgi:predicted phage terminase large subunit-like protein